MPYMLNERHLKDLLYQGFARIGKSLSSPKRLEILDLLSQGPKSVEALSKDTMMSVANVSKHLQTLANSKLVKSHI
jgi:DNA-binding transcriptional ArsR family regulator